MEADTLSSPYFELGGVATLIVREMSHHDAYETPSPLLQFADEATFTAAQSYRCGTTVWRFVWGCSAFHSILQQGRQWLSTESAVGVSNAALGALSRGSDRLACFEQRG